MGTFKFNPAGAAGDFTLADDEDPTAEIQIDLIEGFNLLPQIRGRDWIVPRLDGEEAGNRRLGALILPAAGVVRGSGGTVEARRESFNDAVTALLAALDPSLGVGVLTLADGYLGLGTGEEAVIPGRVQNAAPGRVTGYRTFPQQLWTFEFKCYDPEWTIGT